MNKFRSICLILFSAGCIGMIENVHAEATVVDLSPMTRQASESLEIDRGEPLVAAKNSSQRSDSMEQRVLRLERQIANITEMNLSSKFEKLQQDLQQLRGQIEVQSHDLAQLKDQQRNFYQDFDQRLNKIHQPVEAAGAATTQLAASANCQIGKEDREVNKGICDDSQKELQAYETAFNLLNKKQYDKATIAFQEFTKSYPDSNYAVNAHYWLGEIYYLKAKPVLADKEFQIIVIKYPTSQKVPDAMLKMALIAMDLGNYEKAQQHLQKIQKQFPGTTAAKVAALRLKEVKERVKD